LASRLKITLVKSPIGYAQDQKDTVKALGLGKMWRSVVKDDTPAVRGMVHKVRHLVRVEALPDGEGGEQA
jgi:large subunit ribosomal protein L30